MCVRVCGRACVRVWCVCKCVCARARVCVHAYGVSICMCEREIGVCPRQCARCVTEINQAIFATQSTRLAPQLQNRDNTLSFSEPQGCISSSLSSHQRIKVVFYSPSALQFMVHYSEVLLLSVLSFLTSSKAVSLHI